MLHPAKPILVQGGFEFFPSDLTYLHTLQQRFPRLSRTELAGTLCEHLNWLTLSGQPKITACFRLFARLEETGAICLPKKQEEKSHPGPRPEKPPRVTPRTRPGSPVERPLAELEPVQLRLATDPEDQALWNEYVARYHYLGYKKPFGYVQRYFIEAGPHRLGCLLLSGPAKALTARERWIGWSDRQRLKNLPWVLNNSRFLLFPWVRVANLASHVLGQLARRVADDWERCWGYRPVLLETFVDPVHFHGGCYRAAGWALLGRTTGAGLVRPGKQYQTTPKLILAKPLQKNFRRLLCSEQPRPGRTEL